MFRGLQAEAKHGVCFAGSCRVLAAVHAGHPVQLLLRVPPPLGQAEDPAAAEAAGDQPDRLQRGLQLPHLHAGPKYEPATTTHYPCSYRGIVIMHYFYSSELSSDLLFFC